MAKRGLAALTDTPAQALKIGKQFDRPLHFIGQRFSLHSGIPR